MNRLRRRLCRNKVKGKSKKVKVKKKANEIGEGDLEGRPSFYTMENKDNILDYVPLQNCQWAMDEKGKVYLIKEKTKNKILKKIIGWLGRSQDFHIHLDELGTAAWLQADGQRTILEISAILRQALAAKIEPAETRLARFFALLARDHFVRWKSE